MSLTGLVASRVLSQIVASLNVDQSSEGAAHNITERGMAQLMEASCMVIDHTPRFLKLP